MLRIFNKYNLDSNLLLTFYRSSVESLLTSCITVWYGSCTAADRERLQRGVKAAQRIIGCPLPSLTDIYTSRCLSRAINIIKDSSHLTCLTCCPQEDATGSSGPKQTE